MSTHDAWCGGKLCDCEVYPPQIGEGYVPDSMPRSRRPNEHDLLRKTLPAGGLGGCVSNLSGCKAFRQAWDWLRGGAPWESHVVLEALWHEARRSGAPEAWLLQALIHAAVAKLKQQAGRPVGAHRQSLKAKACWEKAKRLMAGRELSGLARAVANLVDSI